MSKVCRRYGVCGDCAYCIDISYEVPGYGYCGLSDRIGKVELIGHCVFTRSKYRHKTYYSAERLATTFRGSTVEALLHAIYISVKSPDFDMKHYSGVARAAKQLEHLEKKYQRIVSKSS